MIRKSGIFENYREGNMGLFTLGEIFPVTQWITSSWDGQAHLRRWCVQCGEAKYLLSLPEVKPRFLGHKKLSVITTLPELLRPFYVRESPSECHSPKDTSSHPGGLKSLSSLQWGLRSPRESDVIFCKLRFLLSCVTVLLLHVTTLNFVLNWAVLITTQSGIESQIHGQVSPHYCALILHTFSLKVHIYSVFRSSRMRLCVFGRVPDVSKYRSAFIVKVKPQCFYLDQLGLCMSVVTVFVTGCRIQNPTVHPVCQGFRKNCNWKSAEISPAGTASKRT